MFERFTDRARTVVKRSQREAERLNHNYIGTEHLLLGLIGEGTGVAAVVLTELGLSLDSLRQQVEEIIGRAATHPGGHIPFTPRAKKCLELSLREALQLGHNYIGTEHLLLGLIREGEGVAAQVLIQNGISLAVTRERVIHKLVDSVPQAVGSESMPVRKRPWRRKVDRAIGSWTRLSQAEMQVLELLSDGKTIEEVAQTLNISTATVQNHLKNVLTKQEMGKVASSEADPGPACPGCEAKLRETARYEMLDVSPRDGDGVAPVLFLYCSSCGLTIDDVILPGD